MQYRTTLPAHTPIVITIGNFDGIHLGHQRLLHTVCTLAKSLHCTPVMVTFSPHTLAVVRPEIHLQLLTTLDEKLALAKQYGGVADSIVISFTPEVVALSAEAFLDALRQGFELRGIVVGSDFSLGRNRMGNTDFLRQYGEEHAIAIQTVTLEEQEQMRISSTRIRTLVSQGEVAEANLLLGHPLIVQGLVQHGAERGRQLGFPTANLHPDPQKLLPADGVYAVRVHVHIHKGENRDLETDSPVYNGVVNIGIRPTFNGKERLIEVHLLNTNLNLYEKGLTVEFIQRLRGEQRFPSIEALKAQITADAQEAYKILTARRVSQ